jgi:hypothetical protein
VDEALVMMTGEGLVKRDPIGGRAPRAPVRRRRSKKR